MGWAAFFALLIITSIGGVSLFGGKCPDYYNGLQCLNGQEYIAKTWQPLKDAEGNAVKCDSTVR